VLAELCQLLLGVGQAILNGFGARVIRQPELLDVAQAFTAGFDALGNPRRRNRGGSDVRLLSGGLRGAMRPLVARQKDEDEPVSLRDGHV
jgi:hypothetical protein